MNAEQQYSVTIPDSLVNGTKVELESPCSEETRRQKPVLPVLWQNIWKKHLLKGNKYTPYVLQCGGFNLGNRDS